MLSKKYFFLQAITHFGSDVFDSAATRYWDNESTYLLTK